MPPLSRSLRWLIAGLRYGLTLALVGGLGWWLLGEDWVDVAGRFEVGWFGVGLAVAGLAYVFNATRFRVLMHLQGLPLGLGRATAITLLGQCYNAFLPTGIGGDLARLHRVFRLFPAGKAGGATAVLVDRLLGLGSLVLLGGLALLAHAGLGALPVGIWGQLGWPLGVAAIVLVVGFALGVRLRPESWPTWVTRAGERVLTAERWTAVALAHQRALGQPRRQAAAWGWSLLVWVAEFASAWALAQAAGLEVTLTGLVLAVIVANLAAVLPLGIGGHGVREGALLASLALVEGDATLWQSPAALVFALLFLATNVLWSVAGALFILTPSGQTPAQAKTEAS